MYPIVILPLIVVGLCLGSPYAAEPKDEYWWMERHESYVNSSVNGGGSISAVFFGDSITEGWGSAGKEIFDSKYAPQGAVNYGIGSDRVEHVLWRVINGEIEAINPKVFVVKIGTNNFWMNDDLDIVAGLATLTGVLRGLKPQSKVLLLGILPRQNNEVNFRVRKVNSLLGSLDDGNTVRFLDMYNSFVDEYGYCDSSLYESDMLHLVTAGYQRWSEVMDPLFTEMIQK